MGARLNAQVETGDPVPFCAQHTTTTLVPARLALKLRLPLVPLHVERLRSARFRVTLHDPVLPEAGPVARSSRQANDGHAQCTVEAWILERHTSGSARRRVLQTRAPGGAVS